MNAAQSALEGKFGVPKSSRPGADTYFNPKSGRRNQTPPTMVAARRPWIMAALGSSPSVVAAGSGCSWVAVFDMSTPTAG